MNATITMCCKNMEWGGRGGTWQVLITLMNDIEWYRKHMLGEIERWNQYEMQQQASTSTGAITDEQCDALNAGTSLRLTRIEQCKSQVESLNRRLKEQKKQLRRLLKEYLKLSIPEATNDPKWSFTSTKADVWSFPVGIGSDKGDPAVGETFVQGLRTLMANNFEQTSYIIPVFERIVEDHNGIVSEGFKATLMSALTTPGGMFHVLPVSPAEQERRDALRKPGDAEPEPEEDLMLAADYAEKYGEQNKQLWRLFNLRDPDLMQKVENELQTRRQDEKGFVVTWGERHDAMGACNQFIHSNFRHGPEEKRKFEDMLRFVAGEFYEGNIILVCKRMQVLEWRMRLLRVKMEWATVREVATVCSERHLNLADALRPKFITAPDRWKGDLLDTANCLVPVWKEELAAIMGALTDVAPNQIKVATGKRFSQMRAVMTTRYTTDVWGKAGRGGDGGGTGDGAGGKGKCHYCGKGGHHAKECPDKPAGGDDACWNCGETGHQQRNCPKPRTGGGNGFVKGKSFKSRGSGPKRASNFKPSPDGKCGSAENCGGSPRQATLNTQGAHAICDDCYTVLCTKGEIKMKDNSVRKLNQPSGAVTRYTQVHLDNGWHHGSKRKILARAMKLHQEEVAAGAVADTGSDTDSDTGTDDNTAPAATTPAESAAAPTTEARALKLNKSAAMSIYEKGVQAGRASHKQALPPGNPFDTAYGYPQQFSMGHPAPPQSAGPSGFNAEWESDAYSQFRALRAVKTTTADDDVLKLLRTELGDEIAESPMCGTPKPGECRDWIHGAMYVEVIIDGAAQDNVTDQAIEPYMAGRQESRMVISGSLPGGGAVPGRMRGQVSMVAFSTNASAPHPTGVWTSPWESGQDMPYCLGSEVTLWTAGYSIHKGHDPTMSCYAQRSVNGVVEVLPFDYHPASRSFVMRVIVAKNVKVAQKQVRRILHKVRNGEEWRFWKESDGTIPDYMTPTAKMGLLARRTRAESHTAARAVTRSQLAAAAAKSAPTAAPGAPKTVQVKVEPTSPRSPGEIGEPNSEGASGAHHAGHNAIAATAQQHVDNYINSAPALTGKPKRVFTPWDPKCELEGTRPRTVTGTAGTLSDKVSEQTEYESFVATLNDEMDVGDITATKQFLAHKFRGMTAYALHQWFGHVGTCDKLGRRCRVCAQTRWAQHFVRSKVDPHISTMPMWFFTMDSLYLERITRWGNRYVNIGRDVSTGKWLPCLWVEHRNQFLSRFRHMVRRVRSDPKYNRLPKVIAVIGLDPAGEWQPWLKELYELETELELRFVHTPGDGDKRAAAYNEVAVLHFFRRTKNAMIENTVPLAYIEEVGNNVTLLSDLLPLSRDIRSKSGDAPTVLERATDGFEQRAEHRHLLNKYVPVGVVALVSLARASVHASDASGTFLEVLHCIGNYQGVALWENPQHGGLRRSNNYTVIPTPLGTNIFTLLKLPELAVNTASRAFASAPPSDLQIVLNLTGLHDGIPAPPEPDFDTIVYNGTHMSDEGFITLRDLKTGKTYNHAGKPCAPPADGVRTREIAICIGTDEGDNLDKMQRLAEIDKIQNEPASVTGAVVWKRFPKTDDGGSLEHRGLIVGNWKARNGHAMFAVQYDDGEREDLGLNEVVHHVVDKFSSPYRHRPRVLSKPHERFHVPDLGVNRFAANPEPEPESEPRVERNPLTGMASTNDDVRYGIDGTTKYRDPYSRQRQKVNIWDPRNVYFKERHVNQRHASVHTVGPMQTFRGIARKCGIPENMHRFYYNWLGQFFGQDAETAPPGCLGFAFGSPWEGGSRSAKDFEEYLPAGARLPLPGGPSWQQWRTAVKRDAEMDQQDRRALRITRSMSENVMQLMWEQAQERKYGGFVLGLTPGHGDEPFTVAGLKEREHCKLRKVTATAFKKYMGERITAAQLTALTDSTGHIIEPKGPRGWEQIKGRPDEKEFTASREKEHGKINHMDVMSLPTTRAMRLELGVQDIRPVPLKELFEIKKTPNQEYDKHKCRLVLVGAPHAMPAGSFGKTHAGTPLMATTRLLVYVVVQEEWIWENGDVDNAYLEAWMKLCWRVPVKMPEDKRTFTWHPAVHAPTGAVITPAWKEETYPLMQRGLYGHPGSGKAWAKEKNKILLGVLFNYEGYAPPPPPKGFKPLPPALQRRRKYVVRWRSKLARYDPCCVVFARTDNHNETTRLIMVTYVDDLDVAAETLQMSLYMWAVLGTRLGITRGNPDNMLGMRRTRSDDGKSITFDQCGYIEKMYMEFKLLIGDKIPKTPMPPGTYVSTEGIKELLAEFMATTAGRVQLKKNVEKFLKGVGMLLWLVRTVVLEASQAVNSLCRHAACPSDKVLELVWGVMAYCYGVRDVGITFRKVDNPRLEAYYDASNKADPADGDRAQAGYVIFIGGGPIEWRSWRIQHAGLSAQHNEYSALAVVSQAITWLRALMEDMGLTAEIDDPRARDGRDVASLTADPEHDLRVTISPAQRRRDDFGNLGWTNAPTPTLGDNNAAVNLARENLLTVQNRFYSRLCHYAKEAYEQRRTKPLYTPTDDNLGDGFTKAVSVEIAIRHFAKLRGLLAKEFDENRVQGGTGGRSYAMSSAAAPATTAAATPTATTLSSRPLRDDEAAPPEPEMADDYVPPTGKTPAGRRG
mgnify:CR=1 FL=1